MVGFRLKNVSRNKKKDLTLEIPQEKALPMQSTLNIKKEKLTLDIPQEKGSHDSTSSTSTSAITANSLLSPSLEVNTQEGAPLANVTLSQQKGQRDYFTAQFLQDILISWPVSNGKTSESMVLQAIKDSFYIESNNGTPSQVAEWGLTPGEIFNITEIYGVWYDDFYISGVAPNRFINYGCRILAKVSQPPGLDCEGNPSNGTEGPPSPNPNAAPVNLIQNIPFLLTFDEGRNSSNDIQILWLPKDYFLTTPNGGQNMNPNYLPPNNPPYPSAPWFGPNYFVCLPTKQDLATCGSVTGVIYSSMGIPTNNSSYIQVWWNPLLASLNSNTSLLNDPKLAPPTELISVTSESLLQLANAWNVYTYNQNKPNLAANSNFTLPSFGEVLGIYYYNSINYHYSIDNFTPIFNCLVWYSTTEVQLPQNSSTATTSVTAQLKSVTNYYCSMFEYWVGFGPSTYAGNSNKNFSSNLQSQNNMWIYNPDVLLPTWVASSISPNFTSSGVAAGSVFKNIYYAKQDAVAGVRKVRLNQIAALKKYYVVRAANTMNDIITLDNQANPKSGSVSTSQMDTYNKQFAQLKANAFIFYDLIRMLGCRDILLDMIHKPISFNLLPTSKYTLQLYSSSISDSVTLGTTSSTTSSSTTSSYSTIFDGGLATFTNYQTTSKGNTYVGFYSGTWSTVTYLSNDSYKVKLLAYLVFKMSLHNDTSGKSAITFYIAGYNNKGICDFYDATGFGLTLTEPQLTTIEANQPQVPRGVGAAVAAEAGKNIVKPLTRGLFSDIANDIVTAARDVISAAETALDAIKKAAEELADETEKAIKYIEQTSEENFDELVKYVESNYWNLAYLGAGIAGVVLFPEFLGTQMILTLGAQALGYEIGGPVGNAMFKDAELFGFGQGLATGSTMLFR